MLAKYSNTENFTFYRIYQSVIVHAFLWKKLKPFRFWIIFVWLHYSAWCKFHSNFLTSLKDANCLSAILCWYCLWFWREKNSRKESCLSWCSNQNAYYLTYTINNDFAQLETIQVTECVYLFSSLDLQQSILILKMLWFNCSHSIWNKLIPEKSVSKHKMWKKNL